MLQWRQHCRSCQLIDDIKNKWQLLQYQLFQWRPIDNHQKGFRHFFSYKCFTSNIGCNDNYSMNCPEKVILFPTSETTPSPSPNTNYIMFSQTFPFVNISEDDLMHPPPLKGADYKSFDRFFHSIIGKIKKGSLKLECCQKVCQAHEKFIERCQQQMKQKFNLARHKMMFLEDNQFSKLNKDIMFEVIKKQKKLVKEWYVDRPKMQKKTRRGARSLKQRNQTSHLSFVYQFKIGARAFWKEQDQGVLDVQKLKPSWVVVMEEIEEQ